MLLNELLKNNPTPTKSNHKEVKFGSCCLIGKVVQNEVKIEDILSFLDQWQYYYLSHDGTIYKVDTYFPVFSWTTKPCQWDGTAKMLLGSHKKGYLCKCWPIDVFNIISSYLISNSSFKNVKDILYNDVGAWKHNSFPLKYFVADKSSRNNDFKPSTMKDPSCYILKHYQNISSPNCCNNK